MSYLLYGGVVLGALAILLALPGTDRSRRIPAAALGVAAALGLLVLMSRHVAGGGAAFFYFFAGAAMISGGLVITSRRPVYSVLYFVLTVLAVAGLLVLIRAEFLAVALIIIYAGAILVTYVFVLMLAQQSGASAYDSRARAPAMAVLVSFCLLGAVLSRMPALGGSPTPAGGPAAGLAAFEEGPVAAIPAPDDRTSPRNQDNTDQVGTLVLGKYVLALEIAGLLLLVAVVGAIIVATKKVPRNIFAPPPEPVGEIGRKAAPF